MILTILTLTTQAKLSHRSMKRLRDSSANLVENHDPVIAFQLSCTRWVETLDFAGSTRRSSALTIPNTSNISKTSSLLELHFGEQKRLGLSFLLNLRWASTSTNYSLWDGFKVWPTRRGLRLNLSPLSAMDPFWPDKA